MADFFVGLFYVSSISILLYLIKPATFGFFSSTRIFSRITILSFWLLYQFLLVILIGFFADRHFESEIKFPYFFLGVIVQLLIIIVNSVYAITQKKRISEANPLPYLIHQPAFIRQYSTSEIKSESSHLSKPSLKDNLSSETMPIRSKHLNKSIKPKPIQYLPEFRISYYDLNNALIISEISVIEIFTQQEETISVDYLKAYCLKTNSVQNFRIDRLTYVEELNIEKIYFADQDIKTALLNYLK